MTSSEEPADFEGATRDRWPPFCVLPYGDAMNDDLILAARKVAHYYNGAGKTRIEQIESMQALQALVKDYEASVARAASNAPSSPK